MCIVALTSVRVAEVAAGDSIRIAAEALPIRAVRHAGAAVAEVATDGTCSLTMPVRAADRGGRSHKKVSRDITKFPWYLYLITPLIVAPRGCAGRQQMS